MGMPVRNADVEVTAMPVEICQGSMKRWVVEYGWYERNGYADRSPDHRQHEWDGHGYRTSIHWRYAPE